MEKYTSLDRRSPRPYLFLAAIFAVMTGLCYAARSSEGLGFFLSWYLAIDPEVTSKECAVGLMATAVLAASPSLRRSFSCALSAMTTWLKVPIYEKSATNQSTWAILAGMRFVLACMVMYCHTGLWLTPQPKTWFDLNIPGQNFVIGFFFISGLSIAASINREPIGYATRRLRRIAPMYFTALALAVVPLLVHGHHFVTTNKMPVDWPGVWVYIGTALFLQTWLFVTPNLYSPFWSLGCEVWYYMLAPWLRVTASRVILGLCAVSLVGQLVFNSTGIPHLQLLPLATAPCLLWTWLAGYLLYRNPSRMLAFVVLPTALYETRMWPAIVPLAVMLAAPYIRVPKKIQHVLKYMGEISYPIYLTHWAVFITIGGFNLFHNGQYYMIPVMWALCVGIAAVMYHCIDRRFRTTSATSPASTQAKPTGSPLKAPS